MVYTGNVQLPSYKKLSESVFLMELLLMELLFTTLFLHLLIMLFFYIY